MKSMKVNDTPLPPFLNGSINTPPLPYFLVNEFALAMELNFGDTMSYGHLESYGKSPQQEM